MLSSPDPVQINGRQVLRRDVCDGLKLTQLTLVQETSGQLL